MRLIEPREFFNVENALNLALRTLKDAVGVKKGKAVKEAEWASDHLTIQLREILRCTDLTKIKRAKISNGLLKSYLARYAIIYSCVEELRSPSSFVTMTKGDLGFLEQSVEKVAIGVGDIIERARGLASAGKYRDILSLLGK